MGSTELIGSKPGAFATLVTRDKFLAGVLVLNRSFRDVKSRYPLIAMYTDTLSEESRRVLKNQGMELVRVDFLSPPEETAHGCERRFVDAWTKVRAFELIEYERVVLLDCDMVIRRNFDELITMDLAEDYIAGAHACTCNPRRYPHYPADWTPANCAHTAVDFPAAPPVKASTFTSPTQPRTHALLNTGLVVLRPSLPLLSRIDEYLCTSPLVSTFTFADQDLLAHFFEGRWTSINWYYNALKPLKLLHEPMWDDGEVRCLHYIFAEKPWDIKPGEAGDYESTHKWWWEAYALLEKDLEGEDVEFVKSFVPALKG